MFDAAHLVSALHDEPLHSRYFTLESARGVFFSMQLTFLNGAIKVALTQVNQNHPSSRAVVSVRLSSECFAAKQDVACRFEGLTSSCSTTFDVPREGLSDMKVEIALRSFAFEA